jgi:hypothetical protein
VAALLIGILTGALGMAYIVYGKRETKFAPLLSGIGLCAYSYFIDSWVWLCVVGLLFAVVPFVVDL